MTSQSKIPLRFLQSVPVTMGLGVCRYFEGETAWFDEPMAATLIKKGFAERDTSAALFSPAYSRFQALREEEERLAGGRGG